MDPALWAAKTGLDAQQTRMAVTSNNLANVNTSGFKKGRAVFEDLFYQNVRQVGASTSEDSLAPSGLSLGTGVRVVATEKIYTQGSLTQTANPLDVAIQGRGFFQVSLPDGTLAYTRDGAFQLNADGELVTSSGYRVQPGINIPTGAQSISIGTDGVVSVQLAGQPAPTQVGTLQVVDFVNPAGLQARGENLLLESAASKVRELLAEEPDGATMVLRVAIQGGGYFQILHPDGTVAYTRDGSFSLDQDGRIVNANGYPLEPSITVPANTTSVTIGSDGTVSALVAGNTSPTQIGSITLAQFINPTGLEALGGNLYRQSAASGDPEEGTPGRDGLGTLIQGALESSNVNVVEELVNMIETQRAYEMNSKAISTTDQMLAYVTNQL